MSIIYHPNGQWLLSKGAPEEKIARSKTPTIHDMVGNTHTVEVHPHMDHLYNIKGHIKDSGKPHVQFGDLKRAGFSSKVLKDLPRDAHGKVTPEMIDEHIAKLPKHKVQVHIAPYQLKMQQHRDDVPQYTTSVGIHPETLMAQSPQIRNTWNKIKNNQHDLKGHEDQFGWARIDPFKSTGEEKHIEPNDGHWHMDEIQSDFGSPEKLRSQIETIKNLSTEDLNDTKNKDIKDTQLAYHNANKEHNPDKLLAGETPEQKAARVEISGKKLTDAKIAHEDAIKKWSDKSYGELAGTKEMHDFLSHGHEDPQHLVHSAINELGRKNGIKSMSMDTPKDQARQSNLMGSLNDNGGHDTDRYIQDAKTHSENNFTSKKITEDLKNNKYKDNHYLQSALKKIPHKDIIESVSNAAGGSEAHEQFLEHLEDKIGNDKLSGPEQDALQGYIKDFLDQGPNYNDYNRNPEAANKPKEFDPSSVPVHQQNTYSKRPKALGMKNRKKQEVLGAHNSDKDAEDVQYMRLHKKLEALRDLAKAVKRG